MANSKKQKRPEWPYWPEGQPFHRFLIRTMNEAVSMFPFALVFGLRYYYDRPYRHHRRKQYIDVYQNVTYGSNFLNNKARYRKELAMRDGPYCRDCVRHKVELSTLTIDHIVPISAGGSRDIENMQLLCPPCHATKSKIDVHKKDEAVTKKFRQETFGRIRANEERKRKKADTR